MEELTQRQTRVLDILDEEIEALEKKLAKVQPYIDELNKLRQTRRVLLSERQLTGGGGVAGPRLSMEEVITAMRSADRGMTVSDLAEAVGFNESTVRSHLNRHKDERYEKNGDGLWSLIGEEDED